MSLITRFEGELLLVAWHDTNRTEGATVLLPACFTPRPDGAHPVCPAAPLPVLHPPCLKTPLFRIVENISFKSEER